MRSPVILRFATSLVSERRTAQLVSSHRTLGPVSLQATALDDGLSPFVSQYKYSFSSSQTASNHLRKFTHLSLSNILVQSTPLTTIAMLSTSSALIFLLPALLAVHASPLDAGRSIEARALAPPTSSQQLLADGTGNTRRTGSNSGDFSWQATGKPLLLL